MPPSRYGPHNQSNMQLLHGAPHPECRNEHLQYMQQLIAKHKEAASEGKKNSYQHKKVGPPIHRVYDNK